MKTPRQAVNKTFSIPNYSNNKSASIYLFSFHNHVVSKY